MVRRVSIFGPQEEREPGGVIPSAIQFASRCSSPRQSNLGAGGLIPSPIQFVSRGVDLLGYHIGSGRQDKPAGSRGDWFRGGIGFAVSWRIDGEAVGLGSARPINKSLHTHQLQIARIAHFGGEHKGFPASFLPALS